MPTIIPRWEWRAFGQRFGSADAAFAALTPTGVQESDELYLLSGAGDNVKVRADLMDIKILVEVNPDGLEQWRPVMKAGFPLAGRRRGNGLRVPSPAARLRSTATRTPSTSSSPSSRSRAAGCGP